MLPSERFGAELARLGYRPDEAQLRAAAALDAVHAALCATPPHPPWPWRWLTRRSGPVPGLYLWGGVGRGKTFLMDCFFESLPFREKSRLHFHRFMHDVHARLKRERHRRDPLRRIAAQVARETRVICFDEFFVSDIADAMILGTLLENLFAHGVTLVATSNVKPSDLYRDGLQRARFLPAIALIERFAPPFAMEGGIDYRLRTLERAELYHWPLDERADDTLASLFEHLAGQAGEHDVLLDVADRPIPARRRADGVVWFDFEAICEGPRGTTDYIEIARCFHTVLVSNVPRLAAERDNAARRFIALIDEFYDRNVKLALSAATPPEMLYEGERLRFEFARTVSRLREMQSHAYLARQHLP
ncbi:MAG TPA: cell division protein ZapE [Gammaproteobacteria bacterium]|nr:cell division protein ZapE [Gammaproteobacteria bacterium]